eukprot:9478590-Pyramimonas_sp.AAC.1
MKICRQLERWHSQNRSCRTSVPPELRIQSDRLYGEVSVDGDSTAWRKRLLAGLLDHDLSAVPLQFAFIVH